MPCVRDSHPGLGRRLAAMDGPRAQRRFPGNRACLDVTQGDTVWKKSPRRDFAGSSGKWAYAESPLVEGDNVVASPGGKSATVVALNKKDGATVWKTPIGEAASYGSPIRVD